MSDLDEKLGDSIVVGFLYGIQSDTLTDEEVKHRVVGFRQTKGYKEALSHAKRAFIDAGWVDTKKPITGDIHGVGVYEVKADFSKGVLSELMTGQEWYDKFITEAEAFNYGHRGSVDLDLCDDLLRVAKKAAGIE